MVKVARPVTLFTLPVPICVLPSKKVTVPSGTPVPGPTAATVAVKVTGSARPDGLPEVASVVVVALRMFSVSVPCVVMNSLVLLSYITMILCAPIVNGFASVAVEKVAVPVGLSGTAAASSVVPS